MKILYVAPGIHIEGIDGGAVHTWEVSQGLKQLGYQVYLIVKGDKKKRAKPQLIDGIRVHHVLKWLPAKLLQWIAFPSIYKIARQVKPGIIIERYYNFGGGGILAAHLLKITSILEVNSPVVDHPGSAKVFIDKLLIFKPMKRWREALCRWSDRIITPLPAIIPSSIEDEKVIKINWGANVDRFQVNKTPGVNLRKELGIDEKTKLFVFIGSFRKWHGLPDLIEASNHIYNKHKKKDIAFLLIGGGPESSRIKNQIIRLGLEGSFYFLGRIPHNNMPSYLAMADAGIAPFNTKYHRQLKLGFYWSPLKIFEFMAAGLPVITTDISPLNEIIRHEQEGFLYEEGNPVDLAEKILLITTNNSLAKQLGNNARKRAVKNYSWKIHCQKLDTIIKELVEEK